MVIAVYAILMATCFGVSNGSAAASVPSDPRIDVCLAQIPASETNPLRTRSRSGQNVKNWVWAATLNPNCFGVAEVPTGRSGPRFLPRNLIGLV